MQAKNKNKPQPQAEEEKIEAEEELNNSGQIISEEEEPVDLVEGDDLIEMDIKNEKKIEYSFTPPDGELENESEDTSDLPEEVKKTGNRYNPSFSSGPQLEEEDEMQKEGIFVANSDEIGFGYSDNDYAKEEAEEN